MAKSTNISKTAYCRGVQCPKMMWLKEYNPEAFDNSVVNQSALNTGNEVGDLAMGLFGPFTEVKRDAESKMSLETEKLIASGEKVITEASFLCDGLFCSVDILKNLGDKKVELYEVKSSTSVSEIYLHDVAFQVFVLEKCGFTILKANIVYINNKYKRGKKLELDKLFVIENVTDKVREMQPEVHDRIISLKEYFSKEVEPDNDLGRNCFDPYECGFWKYCAKKRNLPEPSVFDLHSRSINVRAKEKYYRQGIISYKDLLEKAKLDKNAELQIRHELYDLADYIETDKIKEFLDNLTYPLYFLDFEAINPAIPPYEKCWPFEQIPFQYSLHFIEEKGGSLKHKELLAEPGKDPRREVAEKLCEDIPLDVCTLAYHMTFEKDRIKELADLYPDLADHLLNIRDNIVDLEDPFKNKQYYTRAMKGKSSIKYVLPALFPDDPELNYKNLEGVHNGTEASAEFIAEEKMSPEELAISRHNLLKYCRLDTFAMVKVLEKLYEAVEQGS